MKHIKDIYKTLCGFALILLMAGCANVLNGPAAPKAKTGKVTFTVGSGPARTVVPSLAQFEKIVFSFEAQNGAPEVEDIDASSGSAEVELPPGAWKVTAKAYVNAGDIAPVAASTAHDFSYDGETLTGDTRFILVPAGTGLGTLKYTITVPNGITLATGSRILIALPEGIEIESGDFPNGEHDISNTETGVEVALPAGSYAVDILLVNGSSDTAVFQESVVILSGLLTELSYEPAATAFLDPEVRAALSDITDLSFNTTELDTAGIVVDNLTATADPFVYTLAINAPAETNPVYFTLTKTAGHSVVISGDNAALVSSPADAEGSTANDTLAVFAVDTASVLEEGGDLHFTLNVEEEGKAAVEIVVTLTVEAPALKLLWIDTAEDGEEESLTAVPDQAAITDLQAALDWLAANAEDDTKYVVKVAEASQLTDSFSSKSGSNGVRITLRGMDGEKVILTNAELSHAGLFTVNAGTTLVLDENITVDGQHKNLYEDYNTRIGKHLFYVNGGTLEMKEDSRITRALYSHGNSSTTDSLPSDVSPSSVLVENNGAFNMYGGTIDQSRGRFSVVYVNGGSFEMWEGAVITNNDLLYDQTENWSSVAKWVVYGSVAAVVVSSQGSFTMRGGEISNTNYRGVFLKAGTFIMQGGRIINNGNSGYVFNGIDNYARGSGVHGVSSARFHMEGGEISGNGNTDAPGSGIWVRVATDTDQFVLNGPVTIQNNTIMFANADGWGTARLGSGFSTESTINIDLVHGADNTNLNTFKNAWSANKLLLYALEEGDDTIAIDNGLTSKFSVAKCFSASSTQSKHTEFPTLSATINADSSVTIVENGGN